MVYVHTVIMDNDRNILGTGRDGPRAEGLYVGTNSSEILACIFESPLVTKVRLILRQLLENCGGLQCVWLGIPNNGLRRKLVCQQERSGLPRIVYQNPPEIRRSVNNMPV
jgi:hypothetical protein